ncbi:MAG: 50S ribosomal protein L24 [Gammaproteobacteria bacterium]|nr:50S ribosomal protein L24 [Gammaproteobacteria bacterium]MDH5593094.1 50S ribosomal protein L24 [Gammaproteobacteria bacterium]MDH5613719.1 50S ribosomal protein L24 [Gammaproteobacteria bacterium]
MNKIRKGDEVIVITGKDKGKQGTVLGILDRDRILVENINIAKRHTKPNPQQGVAGGIVEKEMPLHMSNIALFNPVTQKGDKVGIKTLEDGSKVRYFKSNGEVVDS